MEGAAWIPLAISGNPVETANLAVSKCKNDGALNSFLDVISKIWLVQK